MNIAYLSNQFPEASEEYVWEEACEFRKRGCEVTVCSFRRSRKVSPEQATLESECIYVFPIRFVCTIATSCTLLFSALRLRDLILRAASGPEPLRKRFRTLAHTWLGVYLAVRLRGREVTHIHVHHGFFAAWAGMVAARILRVGFSMTLHGSDLLVRGDYIDTKLKNCSFCVTVSEFNRNYIIQRFPECDWDKILVSRIGVDLNYWRPIQAGANEVFSILSVGRLHSVKNHGFLLLACHQLKIRGVKFCCIIAGDGPERHNLEKLIAAFDLSAEVKLLGTVARADLRHLYASADVVALTSHSEGIPVALMEAMSMERIVLAPLITGIPELIRNGKTGFLYEPNSLQNFVAKLEKIRRAESLERVRRGAREHVARYFNRNVNQRLLADAMIDRIQGTRTAGLPKAWSNENSLLQQIQFRVQRDRSLSV